MSAVLTPAAMVLSKKVAHTPGPWLVATSNSWRRVVSETGDSVCEPIKQADGHPDLHFRNGGQDGADARLIAAAPDLLAMVCHLVFFHDQLQRDDIARANALIAKATSVRLPVGSMS